MSETMTTPVAERGEFLRGAALATAGIAAASLLSARPAQAATGSHVTLYFTAAPPAGSPNPIQVPSTAPAGSGPDIQVLNYALALETLEAELYKEAILRLTTGGMDMFGNTITGLGLASTEPDVQYLTEFAQVEADHQAFLTSALGGNWVVTAGAKFDFGFADTNNFGTPALTRPQTVELVYGAELTGVSAYLGAIPFFATKNYLSVAAAILGTEARHTAAVAIVLNAPPFNLSPKVETAPLAGENSGKDTPLTPDVVLYGTGTVAPGTTVPPGGTIGPKTGPNGVVFI